MRLNKFESKLSRELEGERESVLVMRPEHFKSVSDFGVNPGFGNLIYMSDAQHDAFYEHDVARVDQFDVLSILIACDSSWVSTSLRGRESKSFEVHFHPAGVQLPVLKLKAPVNRLVQLWFLARNLGDDMSGYYLPQPSSITRVYSNVLGSHADGSSVDVAMLNRGDDCSVAGPSLIYIIKGSVRANSKLFGPGSLIGEDEVSIIAITLCELVIFSASNSSP